MSENEEVYLQPTTETSYGSVVDVDGACYIKTDRDPGTQTHLLSGFDSARRLTLNHSCEQSIIPGFTSEHVIDPETGELKEYLDAVSVPMREFYDDPRCSVLGGYGHYYWAASHKKLLADGDYTTGGRQSGDFRPAWSTRNIVTFPAPVTILPGKYVCRVGRPAGWGYARYRYEPENDLYRYNSVYPWDDNIRMNVASQYRASQGFPAPQIWNGIDMSQLVYKSHRFGIHGPFTQWAGHIQFTGGVITKMVEGVTRITTGINRGGITQLVFENIMWT